MPLYVTVLGAPAGSSPIMLLHYRRDSLGLLS